MAITWSQPMPRHARRWRALLGRRMERLGGGTRPRRSRCRARSSSETCGSWPGYIGKKRGPSGRGSCGFWPFRRSPGIERRRWLGSCDHRRWTPTCAACGPRLNESHDPPVFPARPPMADRPAPPGRTPIPTGGWRRSREPEALDWAKAENARSLPVLQGDARYAAFCRPRPWPSSPPRTASRACRSPATEACATSGRTPTTCAASGGRRALDSYRTADPQWETTLIDIDALAKAENANWVWKGADCLPPDDTRCLVSLSDGGKDAVTVREFDPAPAFVEGGFVCPRASRTSNGSTRTPCWWPANGSPGQVTASGYAYVLKALKRGQPWLLRRSSIAGPSTTSRSVPNVVRDSDGVVQAVLACAASASSRARPIC
jgi:hypothetical protein